MLPILLISLLPVIVLAEPMLYMFPTNPDLHPPKMYPNQQFMRGKVRDLPDSGVIYLNRIKPIGDEFKQAVEMKVEKISHEKVQKGPSSSISSPSSFERYNSEEVQFRRRPQPATEPPKPIQKLENPEKTDEIKKLVQKPSKPVELTVPEEAELDILLNDLMKNDNMQQTIQKPKTVGRSAKRHMGGVKPRVISFDGTARLEKPKFKAFAKPVKLQEKKLNKQRNHRNSGPDFDPWERMGQLKKN